ncbi:excinuclease ABC subunit C [Priestia aryabhattai]
MISRVNKIDNIKYQVKQLIQENLYREVTPETNHTFSGIYMIYVDHFTSEKIVPIYIGQAKDIQKRYKQHLSEILALNRLSYDEYNKYFLSKSSSFYEGSFKSCKIFKYMLENKCTLQDFRMIVIEEVEENYLDVKEQNYFQKLLPSFFGFNQLNSFLYKLKFRFANSQMNISELDGYLNVLLEDIKGIDSYYEYGFTRFNFEHAMTKDISSCSKDKQLKYDTLLKFENVTSSLYNMCRRYITDFEKIHRTNELYKESYKGFINTEETYMKALELLNREVSRRLKELGIYREEVINTFIYSITRKDKLKYRRLFNKYLKSRNCKQNLYEVFDEQIKVFTKKLEEKNDKYLSYSEAESLYLERKSEMRLERYKMIFPSSRFEAFSLGDRSTHVPINLNEENDLYNTCHIQIYISNNAINRSLEVDKEPFIIRFDYCYIDSDGNKMESKYYINNKTTKNCHTGIEYFEKDFYNVFAIRKEKFKITSLINNQRDNSFISIQAEYKHGINDYTLRGKKLMKLSVVLDEIKQLTDEDTRFSLGASESANCLKKCIANESLESNEFIEKLFSNKLPKIKKKRKSDTKKATRVKKKSSLPKIDSKTKRAEAYKQKVLKRSEDTIEILKYVSSRENVIAQCIVCKYKWEIRSDHLLHRPYCPSCRK